MRLVLHVGLPKTGSTHLQAQLFHHREALARLGLGLPATATGGYWRPPYNLARELLGDPRFEPGLGSWADLEAELQRMQEPVALVSCEGLAPCLGDSGILERLVDAAAGARRSLVVLAVVREPIGWLNSTYQQNVRDFAVTEPFDAFRRRMLAEGALDYEAIFRRVVQDPRIELVAIAHEQIRSEGPLVQLVQALGLDAGVARKLPIVPGRENVSVGPLTLEVARVVGLALRGLVPGFSNLHPRYRSLRKTFREFAQHAGWNAEAFWGWSEAAIDETLTALAPSHEAFAQQVWGEPWPDPSPRGRPGNRVELSDLGEAEAARVMEILARMHQLMIEPADVAAEPARGGTARDAMRAARAWVRAARDGRSR